MLLRFSLSPSDRDRYGGPEFFEYDHEKFKDLDAEQQMELEEETGINLNAYCLTMRHSSAATQRLMLFIARRQAGLLDVWDDFKPQLQRVATTVVMAGDGHVPPSDASTPATSSEAEASASSSTT